MNINLVRRLSRVTTPITASIVLILLSFASGNLTLPDISASSLVYRKFAAAVAFPTIIGFSLFMIISVTKNFESTLRAFKPGDDEFLSQQLNKLDEITAQNIVFACVIGSAVALGYMLSENLLTVELSISMWILNVMAVVFWVFNMMALFQISRLTNYIVNHYLNKHNIDLFGLKNISPFSQFVVSNVVYVSIFFILVPLFWIGNQIPIVDMLAISLGLFILVVFLFKPVLRVQSLIADKKSLTIERFNQQLSEAMESNVCGGRRITDDPRTLRKIASLITAKAEISKVREWPVDVPQSIKALAITASAPLSMVAGSLVDYALNQFHLLGF